MDIPQLEELEWLEQCPHEEEEECYVVDGAEEQTNSELSKDHEQFIPASRGPEKRRFSGNDDANRGKRIKEMHVSEIAEDSLCHSVSPRSSLKDPGLENVSPQGMEAQPVEEKVLSQFASEIEGEYVTVTGPNGDRIYAKMTTWDVRGELHKSSAGISGLLSCHINTLMDKVEQEALRQVLQGSSELPTGVPPHAPLDSSDQLWVDKYAPTSFTELLSDEHTNREVLMWLKQWDSCVFGSQIRATKDDILSALRRHSSVSHNHKSFYQRNISGNGRGHSPTEISEYSRNAFQKDGGTNVIYEAQKTTLTPAKFPDQKILLLCGPPGLGKTTLAHVAARHCGYHVVEINASDDRSTSAVESKILDAVQMNSVIANSRPTCLVIDEIDGALTEGKGAIEAILKMLSAEKRFHGNDYINHDVQSGKLSSRRQPKAIPLARPIICICNNLFVPALRPLRQIAKVHVFVQPSVSRVISRLKYICHKEGFRTSSVALVALAECTDCDIRSCLNTLQFLNKNNEALNIWDVGSQVVGKKDISRTAFDVWKEVFQRKTTKKLITRGAEYVAKNFDFLYSLVTNCGDYELTMDGIHENFLKLRYHDPVLQKTVRCLDILGVSDALVQYTSRTQQLTLSGYQPYLFIAIHLLISQVEKPFIEWPKCFHRYRASFIEKKELLKLWHNKIAPSVSRHLNVESFIEDVVTPLLQILVPSTIRPVALHLLTERERDDLAQLVDTMTLYALTYKHLNNESCFGQRRQEVASDVPALSLDPPIDDFISFQCYHSGHHRLSFAMKQLLAHEIEKKRILHESTSKCGNSYGNGRNIVSLKCNEESVKKLSGGTDFTAQGDVYNALEDNDPISMKQDEESTLVNLALETSTVLAHSRDPKALRYAKKRSGNGSSFYDRFKKPSRKSSQDLDDTLKVTVRRDLRPLLFKFNEGFTNAVKRPVRMHELLP